MIYHTVPFGSNQVSAANPCVGLPGLNKTIQTIFTKTFQFGNGTYIMFQLIMRNTLVQILGKVQRVNLHILYVLHCTKRCLFSSLKFLSTQLALHQYY